MVNLVSNKGDDIRNQAILTAALSPFIKGAMRFCEVLKIRVLNHVFRAAMPAAGVAIATKNWFLLRISPFN
jgi:hypothetical protein